MTFCAFSASLFALFVVGCADKSDAGSSPAPDAGGCVAALPASCGQAPSYSVDIAPLVAGSCLPCHASGGIAADRDLTTYQGLKRFESTALSQVNSCLMPPADAGPDAALTLDGRTELLEWFVCGTPQN